MTLTVSDRFFKNFVNESEIEKQISKGKEALEKIKNKCGKGADFLGWYDLPENYDKIEFSRIKNAAKKIQSDTDILIVIGIGGSYLGARAAIEFIKSPMYNSLSKSTPDIYFAGNNISSSALSELLELCEGKDISLNVISKSGTTTEPAIAFRVFKALLTERYGEEAARERIYVTTDKSRGTLKEFSDLMGYETFIIPDNVGGRYSILTAGGLLPIAVAGIDIDSMMLGARDAMTRFSSTSYEENEALKYAVMRNVLENQGKSLEILAGYEPYMLIFNEWWKQLFGESEGKDKKGIFPASVIFSTDLHSLGQYIQDGQRNLFLTTVNVKNSSHKFTVPNDEKNFDGLNYISGFELDKINKTAMFATLIAHSDGGVPNILIELSDRSEYSFGYLIYFFELACAISGYILGVNPFDQPGVEAYKKNMFALLGKRGYEDIREKIEKRISEQ